MTDRLESFLTARGEFFAAGWIEQPDAPLVRRAGRALRRQLERCAPPLWRGEPLYPAGPYSLWDQGAALHFTYPFPSLSYPSGGNVTSQRAPMGR